MRQRSSSVIRVLLTLGFVFVTVEAFATPVLFDTRIAFNAAVGPHTLITFDEFPGGRVDSCPFTFTTDPCELPIGDATFVATVPLPIPFAPGAFQRPLLSVGPFGASLKLFSPAPPFEPDDFFVNLSSAVFAVDLFGFGGSEAQRLQLWLTEFDGTQTVVTVQPGEFGPAFVGAMSATGFSRAAFLKVPEEGFPIQNVLIDNVAIQSVPEPSVAVLYGIGLIAISLGRYLPRR